MLTVKRQRLQKKGAKTASPAKSSNYPVHTMFENQEKACLLALFYQDSCLSLTPTCSPSTDRSSHWSCSWSIPRVCSPFTPTAIAVKAPLTFARTGAASLSTFTHAPYHLVKHGDPAIFTTPQRPLIFFSLKSSATVYRAIHGLAF